MLRTTAIPIGYRAFLAAACTAGGTTYLAAPRVHDSTATCEVGQSSASLSLQQNPAHGKPLGLLDGVGRGNRTSLVLPSAEALVRAARLAGTAAVMAADYQANYVARKNRLVGRVCSRLDTILGVRAGVDPERRRKREALEETVDALQWELEEAQRDYVAPSQPPSVEGVDAETTDSDDARDRVSAPSKQTLAEAKRRQKETMTNIADRLTSAQDELSALADEEADGGGRICALHRRNALRLLDLCRTNGGVYIKVGQHLANLDLLLPAEYISALSSLFDDAPVSSYEDVRRVVEEELGRPPEEVFDDFSTEPIASASLAQVHVATCRETGRKLAVKVQHRGLRETSRGDLLAMAAAVSSAERLFDDFSFGWICEELTPQLPRELDFVHEGRNAEAAAAHLEAAGLDCVVPRVLWDRTGGRVLAMEFEEGFRATDVDRMEEAGLCRREVARLIASVFNAQIFENGFVHCDPHEANVLLREHPTRRGRPQLVLVDHGLYKRLDGEFQECYARLWRGIVMADVPEIRSACEGLGVDEMYPLLAAMLTSRPFDEVVERSRTGSLDASPVGNGDKAVIRGYAQRYLKEIIAMLDTVPRQMLLIFKMNDCLRHVDMALGSPVNNLVVAGRYASRRVFEGDRRRMRRRGGGGGMLGLFRSWLSYVNALIRINAYELCSRFALTQ